MKKHKEDKKSAKEGKKTSNLKHFYAFEHVVPLFDFRLFYHA